MRNWASQHLPQWTTIEKNEQLKQILKEPCYYKNYGLNKCTETNLLS